MFKTLKRLSFLLIIILSFGFLASCDKSSNGKSAYEIAVENGYKGTEKE